MDSTPALPPGGWQAMLLAAQCPSPPMFESACARRSATDPYVKLYIRVVMQSSRLCKVAFLRLVQGEAGSGKALADVAECST
jgi:hypothetical protein